jgi:outer membrane protein assembly factor BamB
MNLSRTFMRLGILLITALATQASAASYGNWPIWRGTSLTGVVEGANPPTEWSDTENIKWKTAIPGSGLSTPIIWGDQIFILTAVSRGSSSPEADTQVQAQNQRPRPRQSEAPSPGPGGPEGRGGFNREQILKEFDKDSDGQLNDEERAAMRAQQGRGPRGPEGRPRGDTRPNRGGGGGPRGGGGPAPLEHDFQVLAIDRSTGAINWTQTANTLTPHEGHHPTHGYASASPTTDGKHLWVSFGSRGIFCYTLDGELVWDTDLGDMRTRVGFGEALQPAIAGDHLLLTWDHEDQSYLIALDKSTGKEVWRKERDERTSWTTPVIVQVDGQTQAIIAGTNRTRAYNPENGDLIWEAGGLTSNVIPTPVIGHGNVYVASGYQGRAVQAIRLTSKGDVTGTDNIVWSAPHSAPYVASPVLSNGRLYMTKGTDAYLTCFNALTGEVIYQDEKLEGINGIYASPIVVNGHIYFAGKEGTTVVVKDSDIFEVVASNTLDEPIDASPVAIGSDLFIRGHTHLYCISDDS